MIELHAEAPKIIVPLFARTLPELAAQAAAARQKTVSYRVEQILAEDTAKAE